MSVTNGTGIRLALLMLLLFMAGCETQRLPLSQWRCERAHQTVSPVEYLCDSYVHR